MGHALVVLVFYNTHMMRVVLLRVRCRDSVVLPSDNILQAPLGEQLLKCVRLCMNICTHASQPEKLLLYKETSLL